MRVRLFVGAVAASLTLVSGALVTSARADTTYNSQVGGGAAGIEAEVSLYSPQLFSGHNYDDTLTLDVVAPRVELDRYGGGQTKAAVNKTVGPVSVRALKASIRGETSGDPFAEATTSLAGVHIPGTDIHALDTYCRWDSAGPPKAHTSVVGAGGFTYAPPPNTTKVIAGLGTLTLNEQHTDNHVIYINDEPADSTTIYVFAAHLHLEHDVAIGYGTSDIILGFTSCDPLRIPALSGLRLTSTQSGG